MRRTVLLIDDGPADFARCQAALADCRAVAYTLAMALSGDQGLTLIESVKPDCVLLAYSLAGNGGMVIHQRIRARHPALPVVILTGPEVKLPQLQEMKADGLHCLPSASIVTATLHAAIDRAVLESADRDSAKAIAATLSHTVLIIDDNPDDREAFRRALQKADDSYDYLEAADGLSGIAMIERHKPHCVLLDYSLPGLNGLAALQRIHEVDAFLPVIMLTGQGSEAIAVQAMREGAQNYLVKTALTPSLLHRAILSAIEHAALERKIGEQRRQIYTHKLALAETDRLKTAILASAGTMIIATDREGMVLTFNPAAEIALGYSAEDVIGRHTPALWCDEAEIATRAAQLAISHGAKLKCDFEVLTYVPQLTGREALEWTFIRKDGSRFPVCLSMTPLRDGEGQVAGFLGMADDITQRREQELALKTSEETFRSAVENAPNGMALIDPQGKLLKVNPALCTLLGFDADELTDMPLRSIAHPDDGDSDRESVKNLYQGRIDVYRVEKRLLHKSGRVVYVLLSLSLIRYPDGAAKYYVAQVMDITERMEMDRIKSEFISIVSHELRTPLTSIRGSLGLLTGKIVKGVPENAQKLIDIAYKNCERLILLINDILDIDKIASGKMRLDMRPEHAELLMEEAAEAIRGYADDLGVRIRLEPSVAGLMLNVDRDRFIQVLNNLLSNAVKFSPKNGVIELRAEAREGNVRISVRDHGPGIPQQFQDRLFNKFFQADASSTREKGGTGLGLHISRQIIEHMGGHIGFDTKMGDGTTMWVDLPALAADAAVHPFADAMPVEFGRRVLICEDDDRVAWLIQKMLTKEGFAADVVHSIPEARHQLRAVSYAAMTLDLALPSGNGIDFARELSDDAEMSQLPIVIVSGTERASWLELEAKSGIVDWIVKPIDRQRLIASVEKAAAVYQQNAG
jgi:PAS domain S-box-containing protein